jgi:hypothetical protein
VLVDNFNVTVPIPETFTVDVKDPGVVIEEFAVPVDPVCVHKVVPLVAVPAKVNEVGPDGGV